MSESNGHESAIFVTIVCATYNRERSILRAIESVTSQTFENWELLVVDDGSTDCTAKIVEQCLDDQRIKYFPQGQNKGVGYARNFGISRAVGEWVLLLDSDNALDDCALHNIREAIKADCGIGMHKFMVTSFDGRPMSQMVTKPTVLEASDFLSGKLTGEFHTVVKKEALDAVRFFEKFNGGEGIVWSKIALRQGHVKFHPIPTLIYETQGNDRLSLRSKNISRLAQVYKADIEELWLDYLRNSPSRLAINLVKYFIYKSLHVVSDIKRWFDYK